jgi:FkbM family methyltransferase
MSKLEIELGRLFVRLMGNWPIVWRFVPFVQRKFKSLSGEPISRVVKTRHGFKMNVNLGDFIGRHIFLHGEYEDYVTRVFYKLLQPGDVVLDVGANIGYFTLLSASIVGKSGRVISFEASPQIFTYLSSNLSLNESENVESFCAAVGDKNGQVEFFEADDSHLGLSSLRHLDNNNSKRIMIDMIELNCFAENFPKVQLVKVDVEGGEMRVFQGMQKILERDNPFLVFEVTDVMLKELGSSKNELLNWLSDRSYKIFQISNNTICPIPKGSGQFNALGVPCNKHSMIPELF